jgi:hypothetical protein
MMSQPFTPAMQHIGQVSGVGDALKREGFRWGGKCQAGSIA